MKFSHQEPVNTKSGWIKLISYIVPIILLFGIASWFGVTRWYDTNLQPVDENSLVTQTFIVEPGESVRDIATQLETTGIIKNSTVFSWYVERSNVWNDLQAGTYTLSPNMSVEIIVEKLATGDIDTSLVTIFPGRRLDQISTDLQEIGYSSQQIESAFNHSYVSPILADKPPGASLEGYIFPETYQITDDMELDDVIQFALDELNSRVTTQIRQSFLDRDINIHEAMTLASIISQESSNVDTQRKIAGVFFNRLELGMPLGSDPTFKYAAAITGQPVAVDIDSPYNTRIVAGLPPGPISNFNYSALAAVANPDKSDNLFFVSGDNGTTYFSKTLSEHQSNIDKYCDELCKLP